jgi:hypothetical protein
MRFLAFTSILEDLIELEVTKEIHFQLPNGKLKIHLDEYRIRVNLKYNSNMVTELSASQAIISFNPTAGIFSALAKY